MHITKLVITALLFGGVVFAHPDNSSFEKKQAAYEAFIAQKLKSDDPNDVFHAAMLSDGNPNLPNIIEKQLVPSLADTDSILLLDFVINYCLQQPHLSFCQLEKLIKQATALSPSNAKFDLYLVNYYLQHQDHEKARSALRSAATKDHYDSLFARYIESNYLFLAQLSSDKNVNLVAAIGAAAAKGLPALRSLSDLCSATQSPHLTASEKSDCVKFLKTMGETGQTTLTKMVAGGILVDLLDGEDKTEIQKTITDLENMNKDFAGLDFVLLATPDLFVQRLKNLGEVGTFQRYLEDNKKGD